MTENTVDKTRSAPTAKRAAIKEKPEQTKAGITPKAGKKGEKEKKTKGNKVIRDFSMPQAEYEKLVKIKQACIKAGLPVKKNELLRAGLHALGRLSASQLKQALSQVVQIKAGRRRKQKNPEAALSE